MKKLFFVLAGMLTLVACGAQNSGPVLTIEGGQIQGVTTDIKGVTVYRGIPFAAPPTGQNRWKAPQPVIPWKRTELISTKRSLKKSAKLWSKLSNKLKKYTAKGPL